MAFHLTENPTNTGVYEVLITIHGVQHPIPHEPTIFSWFDGVDTWGAWEFSEYRAIRSKPKFKGVLPWREVKPKADKSHK